MKTSLKTRSPKSPRINQITTPLEKDVLRKTKHGSSFIVTVASFSALKDVREKRTGSGFIGAERLGTSPAALEWLLQF